MPIDTMIIAPRPTSVIPVGGEEHFLDWLLGKFGGSLDHPLSGTHEQALAASDEVEVVGALAYLELALWAAPELPTEGLSATIVLPAGSNPIRVDSYLRHTQLRDNTPDNPVASAWRRAFHNPDYLLWPRPLDDRDVSLNHQQPYYSLVMLLFYAIVPEDEKDPIRGTHLVNRQGSHSVTLPKLIETAARLKQFGLDVRGEPTPSPSMLAAAREVLLGTMRRFSVGEALVPPVLTEADLLMLTTSPLEESRLLGVMLAPSVV